MLLPKTMIKSKVIMNTRNGNEKGDLDTEFGRTRKFGEDFKLKTDKGFISKQKDFKYFQNFNYFQSFNFRFIRSYIWIVFSGLVLVSILAQILYPTDYFFWKNTISDQGSPGLNPIGSIYWRIGVILNGIAHIPYIIYLTGKFKTIHPKKAKQFLFVGILSALGFSFVGIFPLDLGAIHYIFALIAFLGYYYTANLSFQIIESQKLFFHRNGNEKKLFPMYVLKMYFQISGILCLGSFILNKFFFDKEISAILEWNYLLAICIWLLFWPRFLHNLRKG
ncbi:MAG: DUF998 domain-containing protein [Candidatus Lokiarchaeota archaeon]|nr:DUF998 domain-containing protein [Candidatus Harpocratesius repetitus]